MIFRLTFVRPFCRLVCGVAAFCLSGVCARAATTVFGQTFYSTNTATSESGGNLVWNTLAGANSEMHTNFAPVSLAIGDTFSVNFDLRFLEPQGDGGASSTDGVRLGLIDLATQTNADGPHTSTTGDGYRFRFNWEGLTTAAAGIAHERTPTGSNAAYLTSSGGIWDQNALNFNGFGLDADGSTAYPVSFSVQRATTTDVLVSLSINGVTRTYSDTGDGAFSFDTFVLSKIGDTAPFTETATFTISNFSLVVIPEPSSAVLMLVGVGAGLIRRRAR